MLENVHNKILGEFPGGLQLGFQPFIAMTWVQSLAVELRSHKLCGTAKKKRRRQGVMKEKIKMKRQYRLIKKSHQWRRRTRKVWHPENQLEKTFRRKELPMVYGTGSENPNSIKTGPLNVAVRGVWVKESKSHGHVKGENTVGEEAETVNNNS